MLIKNKHQNKIQSHWLWRGTFTLALLSAACLLILRGDRAAISKLVALSSDEQVTSGVLRGMTAAEASGASAEMDSGAAKELRLHTYTRDCMGNTSLPNVWCVDTDGVPRFVGVNNAGAGNVTPQVTRYNHAGFIQCLTGKKIVFIGDSRVRYQFMHLSHYLLDGRFMKCQDYSTEPEKGCYIIDERTAGSWNEFYKKSTAMIEEGGHVPQSLCDCYRPKQFNPAQTYENDLCD
ncbi:hypothetical protein THAOC_09032 [Thalassiosira oceanica]|uniref:Uncharacterized protein n=1 Tax=Thalassiosira oceanica TaxID=159749 RepID=K0SXN6_THAOC|nr:hypothetical protein THAOC_09032 [Thalassiosira oceanica]|eukprot:EJK69684.1 hypothetical protein THAOC_09032 [Thalassiosira oceanica]